MLKRSAQECRKQPVPASLMTEASLFAAVFVLLKFFFKVLFMLTRLSARCITVDVATRPSIRLA